MKEEAVKEEPPYYDIHIDYVIRLYVVMIIIIISYVYIYIYIYTYLYLYTWPSRRRPRRRSRRLMHPQPRQVPQPITLYYIMIYNILPNYIIV